MGDRYLTDLADVLAAAGLDVWETDGWRNRARGSGGYNPAAPGHVMVHHTASGPGSDGWDDVNYMTYSHPDAPLCNLYVDRGGGWYVCAAGATNTNGTGSDPCGHIADDSMNTDAIGIECGNNGVGEPWPTVQLDALLVGVGALTAAYGIPIARVHGHVEWAPSRKIDPAGPPRYATGPATWDLDAFRADLTPGGFLMALTDAEQRDLYDRIMGSLPGPYKDQELPAPAPRRFVLDDQDGNYLVALLEQIARKLDV